MLTKLANMLRAEERRPKSERDDRHHQSDYGRPKRQRKQRGQRGRGSPSSEAD